MGFPIFFFQAEDGIRDLIVTGVQTCALPISVCATSPARSTTMPPEGGIVVERAGDVAQTGGEVRPHVLVDRLGRSEERRVGEEGRSRWSPHPLKKKNDAPHAGRPLTAASPEQ